MSQRRAQKKKPAYKVYAPPPPRRPARKVVVRRKDMPVKGPGMLSEGGSALGGMAGSLAGPLGAKVGSFLGGKLGHLVEQITGFGDYTVESNSILDGGVSPPEVVNTANKGGAIIRHREYIGDVLATTAFTTQTFPLNPGLAGSFPWLAQIANSYEQYRWRGLLFEFISTSSDALLSSSTSTALGTVNMATQYDVTDPVFPDKRSMLNQEMSNSRKPSASFIHPVECAGSMQPFKYYNTRGSAVSSDADPARFDFGHFVIATEGQQVAGGVLGELWVTYEVEFLKQQYETIVLSDHFQLGSVSNTSPLGTAVVRSNLAYGGTIGGLLSGDGRTYSFPPLLGSGTFAIQWQVTGGTTTVTAPAITLTNCSYRNMLRLGTDGEISNSGGSTGVLIMIMYVKVTAQGATINWGAAGTLPTSVSSGDLIITQLSPTLQD